ncbi:eukaryotic translation initiation factor 4G isoform X2 [Nymphaea colorata]|uniref:eukaryotic translation initiation factor 4G isoform X2 n=1 Tax=Nymphaea colorata TaxID=210225 RepID=UPI00129EBFD7|nr:eukaryotic translation initiation factor 4G isoform X2 [Nymphaea colorata]
MSLNQPRVEKGEPHTRKSGRSGGPAHHRSSHNAGSGKGGAGGAGTFSALSSSSQASNSHRRKNNGQGGQSRLRSNAANPEVLNDGIPNGTLPHNQPVMASLPGSSGAASVDATRQFNHRLPKGTSTLPRPPSSNSSIGSSGSAPVATQPEDVSKGFPLQFGSISPGFMNGLQFPARTSSAPPNLDEQNCAQAHHDAKPSHISVSAAAKQHQKHEQLQQLQQAAQQHKQQPRQDLSTDFINVGETHTSSQIKRDSTLQAPLPPQASAPKSSVVPQLGLSTHMSFAQSQVSMPFSNPGSQIQSHSGPIQMPLPISVSNAAQVQQQVLISTLQSHPLQAQAMIHQNQGLGYQTHQIGPPLSGLGVGMDTQFSQQAGANFSTTRKAVKITHPDTREELKLDKRADSIVGSSSSGQSVQIARSHAAVAHQPQQPIPSYASPHQIAYYSPILSNSYATSIFYPSQAAQPLNNTQIAPGSSAPIYNFPVSHVGSTVSVVNPIPYNASLPLTKSGLSAQTTSGQMKLEEVAAPAASVRVTVKPPMSSVSEKVGTSSSTSLHSSSISKGTAVTHDGPVKPSRRHDESVSSHFQRGTEGARLISSAMGEILAQLPSTTASSIVPGDVKPEPHVQQTKSVNGAASVSNSLHATLKHSAPSFVAGLQGKSATAVILPEESVDHVTIPEGQKWDPLKKSDSFKCQQKSNKKEQHHLEPENQLAACDSGGNRPLKLDDTSPIHGTNKIESVQVPSEGVPTASSLPSSSSGSGVCSSEVAEASIKDPKLLSAALGDFAVALEEVAEEPKVVKTDSAVACQTLPNIVGIEDKGPGEPSSSVDSESGKAVSENLLDISSENKEEHIHASEDPDGALQLEAERSKIADYCEPESQKYENMPCSGCSNNSSEMDSLEQATLVDKVDETFTPVMSNYLEREQENNEGTSAYSPPLHSHEATGLGNVTNEKALPGSAITSLDTCSYSHKTGEVSSASYSPLDICCKKFVEDNICDRATYSYKAGEVSSASHSPLGTFGKKTEGEDKICDRATAASAESATLNQGLVADELQVSSEMGQKHEIRDIVSINSAVGSSSLQISKDKTLSEQSKAKNISGKRKKKKELLSKADAAGTTSDLYMAYKTPEQKQESAIVEIAVSSPGIDGKLMHSGDVDKNISAKEEDSQSKSELDDWEEAAEISSPNLKAPEKNEEKHNRKHHEKHDSESVGNKRYTRDFLMTFSEQYKELPPGFEIGADIADYILGVHVNVSPGVKRETLHLSGGRVFDRQPSGSRMERRGSGLVEEDRWGKVGFVSTRMDLAYGVAVGGRTSQGGNLGVLKNLRGQPGGQYVSGVLSGSMQPPAPIGGMTRLSADADRWQRAASVQKGLISAPPAAMVVMHKAEKRYEVGKVSDKEVAKQRQLTGILNKLTPQNFEKLFMQVKEVDIDNAVTLRGVISQIFDKALMEPTFCEMYADFCFHLAGALPDMVENNEKITFKRLLLNKCQEEFERGEREQAEADKSEEEGAAKQTEEAREEQRLKSRRRMLGNIRLIGELYKKKMLTERIMHECIKKLLGQFDDPDEEDLEALCKLMSTIGAIIDHPIAKEHMDAYFDRMQKLSVNQKISSRVRFMLRDTIDLRRNKWQQRRKVEGPKKIEEVHRDAAQERQAQAGRTARSSSMGSSARRGQTIDYGSRLPSLLSSPGGQQMSAVRGLPISSRSFGSQDVRMGDKYIFESRTLSVPLSQKSTNDEPITFGPQGGLGKGMSCRGQSLGSSGLMNDIATDSGDTRRMVLGPSGFRSPGDAVSKGLLQDRPASLQAYDQSNLQDHMRKDSRNNHHSSDRSTVTPHATECIQSSPTDADNSFEEISEEQLREKSISAIKEFYSANDEEEVASCVKELNAPYFYPTMVSLWVTDSFERKDRERDELAKLLTFLHRSRNKLLSQEQIIKGFEFVFATLVDAMYDAPKASEFLGVILANIVLEEIVTLADVARLIREGGEEPGCLMETDIASDVLGTVFEVIKKEKGADVLNEMHKRTDIRVKDFLPPDPKKQAKLISFI